MTFRNNRLVVAALLLGACAFLLTPVSTEAKSKKKKKRKPETRQVFFLDAELNFTYDDNIIRYSDADLDLFDQSARPDKFDIESRNDWIVNPQIEARAKGNFLGGKAAWAGLSYSYYYYARNDVRRYQKMGAFARHYVARGGYADIEYSYIPDYYYRNQYVQNIGYVEASFSKHFLKLEIGKDLTSALKADVSYRYQNKSYNPEVSERDLSVNGFRIDGIWQADRRVKFWAYYGFERADAAGADLTAPDARDVSYDAWDITLGARHYSWLLGGLKPEIFSTVQFREIKFRTTKYLDVYRFDRDDHNFRLTAGALIRIWQNIRFDISYSYYRKRVDLPVPANESLLEYSANSVTFGLQRDF